MYLHLSTCIIYISSKPGRNWCVQCEGQQLNLKNSQLPDSFHWQVGPMMKMYSRPSLLYTHATILELIQAKLQGCFITIVNVLLWWKFHAAKLQLFTVVGYWATMLIFPARGRCCWQFRSGLIFDFPPVTLPHIDQSGSSISHCIIIEWRIRILPQDRVY